MTIIERYNELKKGIYKPGKGIKGGDLLIINHDPDIIEAIKKEFFNDKLNIECKYYMIEASYRISGFYDEYRYYINNERYNFDDFINKLQTMYELYNTKKKIDNINEHS